MDLDGVVQKAKRSAIHDFPRKMDLTIAATKALGRIAIEEMTDFMSLADARSGKCKRLGGGGLRRGRAQRPWGYREDHEFSRINGDRSA